MTTFTLHGAEDLVLLHHLAAYGLADILDTASLVTDLRLTWQAGRPVVSGTGLAPAIVEDAVRAHLAGRRTWVEEASGPDRRGVMSPRLTGMKADQAWQDHQHARESVLDTLTAAHAWPDLRYLAALGEPAYWRFNPRGERLPDDGASRLEMQPRNRGSEFVGNRLRPLVEKLLDRQPGQIAAGIAGDSVLDELGGKPDSVSATGLTTPGPVDNALVWCALWGIGQLPLALRTERPAVTTGHLGRPRAEHFYAPVWEMPWRPARLRTILASAQLRDAADQLLHDAGTSAPAATAVTTTAATAAVWLRARGVIGIVRFPVGRFGSDNAPERRALRGDAVPL
jgi:CRISPR-associated protein Csb3